MSDRLAPGVLGALAMPPNEGELIVIGLGLFIVSIALLFPASRG